QAITLVVPGDHALRVHAERDGVEPGERRLLRHPVGSDTHEGLNLALGRGVKALERLHDLAVRDNLDLEAPAAHLVHDLRQLQSRAVLYVERSCEGRWHLPLDLLLGDDVWSVDDRGSSHGRQSAACLHDEVASFHADGLLIRRDESDPWRCDYPTTSWW